MPHSHGPLLLPDGNVLFRLFAPAAKSVHLLLQHSEPEVMQRDANGWYRVTTAKAGIGTFYRFLINGEHEVPDPASHFQPDDVEGFSEVIDHAAFTWSDKDWQGRPWEEAVIYELHVGAFSKEGTFKALEEKLDYLAQLGVTTIELMPVSDFKGNYNWGYDGVLPYAPDSSYGRPEELKSLVNAAHQRGMMVFLDVVYNHFGPVGNYLPLYAPIFFTHRHHTPWGAAINFQQREVRDYFIENAIYWLKEYHIDGLRLDAVHAFYDDSPEHILEELPRKVRSAFPPERHIHLVLENDRNQARYLERSDKGKAIHATAQWNDDIHHIMHVLLTGETDGYYADYKQNTLARLGRSLTQGFDYQGEFSAFRKEKRGEGSDHLPPDAFVAFLQNHDQIGNRAFGERIASLVEEGPLALATKILLLQPSIPLLFMGQEWNTRTGFPFFCHFTGELAAAVREGRKREFASFPAFSDTELLAHMPDPVSELTFESAKLKWRETEIAAYIPWLQMMQKLIKLRHDNIVPLLKSGWIHSDYSIEGSNLRVSWHFEEKILRMTANFSSEPLSDVPTIVGEIVWAEGGGVVPPWGSVWWLEGVKVEKVAEDVAMSGLLVE